MNTLNEKIIEATKKALSLKTKKAQIKAWAVVSDLEDQSFDLVSEQCKEYDDKQFEFTVTHVFSDSIACHHQVLGNLSFEMSSDVLSKSWYSHLSCVNYTVGQKIKSTVMAEPTKAFNRGHYVVGLTLTKIIGGTVNEAKYAELCNDGNKYAFFKYPNKGMTGLFA